ncbi:MAG TPA: hypothetical protein VKB69_00230 [Micromonosporaceae bacterium]|nr:hypothetical protein [Micromonosporaceae bacterium]
MKIYTRLAAGAAGVVMALGLAPVAASADVAPAARTQVTVPCTPTSRNTGINGVTHAQARSCTVLWLSSGASGQEGGTVAFQMRDAATDGVCAEAVIVLTYVNGSTKTTNRSECNGVWTDFSWTQIGTVRPHDARVTLSFGGRGPVDMIDLNPFVLG